MVVVVVGRRVDSDGKENNVRSVVDTAKTRTTTTRGIDVANTNQWQ